VKGYSFGPWDAIKFSKKLHDDRKKVEKIDGEMKGKLTRWK